MPQSHDTTLDHYRMAGLENGLHRENKHDRFIRLAPGRVQRALDKIEMVGRLASSQNAYSEQEARKIVTALTEQVDAVARRLLHEKPGKKAFSFDE